MKNNLISTFEDQRICIVGTNAKSVAAAMMLTYYGFKVDLYGFSDSAEQYIQRYHFDKSLTTQWYRSLENGSLVYLCYDTKTFSSSKYKTYWFFLDQMPNAIEEYILSYIKDFNVDICFSGITRIGRVSEIANNLISENVFYLPFVFLNGPSVFKSTIRPELLLIGEKTLSTAPKNKIIGTLIKVSNQYRVDCLKTIEFTRSCMMNLMAARLSLVNEMARLADHYNVDIKNVGRILEQDDRLGKGFLRAGWGYGGSTLPKENEILINSLKEAELSTKIVKEVANINKDQKELIFRKFWRYFESYVQDKTVLIWGAGYKAGTGRTKGSAIHTILPILWNHKVTTFLFDPLSQDDLKRIYKDDERLMFNKSAYQNLVKVDALIIINWSQDERPDINQLNKYEIPVFDAINLLLSSEINKLNSHYTGIGRGVI